MLLAKGKPEVAVTLPSDTEIRFTCVFRRSRQILFEAWTRPEHIRHWWGCDGASVSVCEVDLRVGGAWKIVLQMPDGSDHPFHGVYREIEYAERLVYTECYDVERVGRPEWMTTVTLEEVEVGTRLTHTIKHRSKEMRDGHLQSGMEAGSIQSMHRLDELAGRLMDAEPS